MSKPENYPEIIYKYRNWKQNSHKAILLHNQLFLSSPKSFNDPFDCRIPINFTLLDSIEKIESYANYFVAKYKVAFERKGINPKSEFDRIVKDFSNNLDLIQKQHEKILYDGQDTHYGVLSLSMRWNSILMWSHYADNHRGYCVGFYEDKLRESGLFGKGGPVSFNADNNYPEISPLEDIGTMEKGFKETHTKAFDWKYEEEYRMNKIFFPNAPTTEDRQITIPDDFFAEIIIGLQTPENSKKRIIKLAKQKNIKVYQAIKVPFRFEIKRQEIL